MRAPVRLRPLGPGILLFLLLGSFGRGQISVQAVGSDHIAVSINGAEFTDFYIGSSYPKPFLAPLRTADGKLVTRRYPMQEVAGESRDHPHHRGLFVGYGSISGVNFWENERSYTTTNRGTIVLQHLGKLTSGDHSGTIQATFLWRKPDGTTLLTEERTMTFRADRNLRVIDFDITFTAEAPADFADTKEGFFAIRMADSMTEKNGGQMINSNGAQGEKNVWGKRADWVDYSGPVDGGKAGIIIFDAPGNFNHPSRWHSRAYGLFAVNPFGLKDFEPGSKEQGGKSLSKDQKLRFRYRVVIHTGDLSSEEIARLYASYSAGK